MVCCPRDFSFFKNKNFFIYVSHLLIPLLPLSTPQVPKPQNNLTSALASLRHTFVVADATLPDCPLIYASEG